MNVCIVFELKSWPFFTGKGFALRDYLFGSVKLAKNANPDKYSCSGYGIFFDVRETFSLSRGNAFIKNVIILMLTWVHLYMLIIEKKIFWYLVKAQRKRKMILHWMQQLNILSVLPNKERNFVLSLHYNGSSSYLFINEVKIYQFK